MNRIPVPYGLDVSVSIRREGDTVFIDVHAPMYVRTEWTMTHQYANTFTDSEILKDHDFVSVLVKHYCN